MEVITLKEGCEGYLVKEKRIQPTYPVRPKYSTFIIFIKPKLP